MSDVIGSAEIEIRATTRQLKGDMAQAEKAARDELKKVEGAAKDAQRELKRAFQDAGASEFERSMRIIRNASEFTEKEVRDAAQRVARDLKGQYRDLGDSIGQSLMGASRTAQVAFGAITAYSLKLASDAQEIESAFKVAFGSAETDARSFSDTLANDVGRDAVVLREQMTQLQLVITGTGVAAGTASNLVKALTTSGVDAGSLFNTSDAEALQKILSGITGETEPLKAFGVVINEASLEAELLRLGFKGTASDASEAAKTIARTNLIIKGLSVAQGDAARTSDSAANTTKRMTAEFNQAARSLGEELLPAMTQTFGAATNVLRAFNDLPGGVQVAGLAFLGLIAAGGPIAGLLAGLGRVIKLANDTRIALAGVTAAQAGAGATGLAAGAGRLLSRAVPVAGAVGGLLSLSGDTNQNAGQGQERVNAQLRAEADTRARIVQLTRQGNSAEAARQQDYLNRITSRRTAEQADAQRGRDLRAGLQDIATAPVDTAVPGGFSLPPGLQTANRNGSSVGRAAASGPSAAEVANLRESLALQAALDLARASGNTAATRAAEERQLLVRLTADYERAGYEDAEAQALTQVAALNDATRRREELAKWEEKSLEFWDEFGRAQERSAELMDMQISDQITIAELSGDRGLLRDLRREEEIRRRIVDLMRLTPGLTQEAARAQATMTVGNIDAAERMGGVRDEFRAAFSDGIQAAIDGDLGGFFDNLADRFTTRMLDNLADDLFDLLDSAGKGGTGGNILSSIGSFFGSFGGGRAAGGPMSAGSWYRTGEHGPENIFMPQNGFAVPEGAMTSAPAGGGKSRGGGAPVHFHMEGAVMTADLLRQAEAMAVKTGGSVFTASRSQIPTDLSRKQAYRTRS